MTNPANLWPHQATGIKWLQDTPRALLADEPGLGKTAQAILASEDLGPKDRRLVICSGGLAFNWKHEITMWSGDEDINIVGVTPWIKGARWNILPWANVAAEAEWTSSVKWAEVIIDEAHYMKNRNSLRSAAIRGGHIARRKTSFGTIKTERVIELTGTPIVNQPADLWALMNYIDHKQFSSYWAFFNRYVYHHKNMWGGYEILGVQNVDELVHLIRPYTLRRLQEVNPRLTRTTIPIPMATRQQQVYKDMRKKFEATIVSERLRRVLDENAERDFEITDADMQQLMVPSVLAALVRLRMIAISPGMLTGDYDSQSPKLDTVMDMLEERRGRQTVIASQFKWPIEALKRRLDKEKITWTTVTGADSKEDRFNHVQLFQAKKAEVLLMTVQTGGEGWTMSAADMLIFIDRPWSPAIFKQTEDRLRSHLQKDLETGLHKPVQIISLQTMHSVEARVEALLTQKAAMFKDVFGPLSQMDPYDQSKEVV